MPVTPVIEQCNSKQRHIRFAVACDNLPLINFFDLQYLKDNLKPSYQLLRDYSREMKDSFTRGDERSIFAGQVDIRAWNKSDGFWWIPYTYDNTETEQSFALPSKIMTKHVLQWTDLCHWSWTSSTSAGIDRNCWNCRQRDFCHDGFRRTQWLRQAACFQDLRKLLFCKIHLNEKRDVIYGLSVLVIFKIMHRDCLKLIFQNMFRLILIFVLKK